MLGDCLRRASCLGAPTLQFVSERKQHEGRIEHLRTQHTEAVRDKSTAENKSQNLLEKVTTLENKKEDFGHRLTDEKEYAEKARVEAQAARTEAHAARKRTANLELELKNMRDHRERTESSTRARVERAHMLFVDAYHDLGAQTAPFDESGQEVGIRFLSGCKMS
jgi:chromosome segregation ATPase